MPKIRNNDKLDRTSVITQVASLVGEKHSVDLEDPKVCILVEGVHAFVGVSVLTEFIEYKKFNLEALLPMRSSDETPEKP